MNIFNIYILKFYYLYLEHAFSSHLIRDCSQIVNYFKKSHQPNAYLQEAIHNLQIPGGGLKKFVDTRWVSAYEHVLSVSRLERAFIKVNYYS